MLYFWPGGASKTGDYSEQQLVDCGFGHEADADNKGCKGAWPHGYVKWMLNKKQNLASEADYPYKAIRETCQSSKKYNQGLIDSYEAPSSTYVFICHAAPRCPPDGGTLDPEGGRGPAEEAGVAARRRGDHCGGARQLHAIQRRHLPGLHQRGDQPLRGGGGIRHGEWGRLLAYQGGWNMATWLPGPSVSVSRTPGACGGRLAT